MFKTGKNPFRVPVTGPDTALRSARRFFARVRTRLQKGTNRIQETVRRKAHRSGACWDRMNQDNSGDVLYWLAVPMLAHEVNRRVTGAPLTWPLAGFVESIKEHLPVRRALSLGCGTGNLEREVAKAQCALQIEGVDVGAASIKKACELAAEEGFENVIRYHCADAAEWLRRQKGKEPFDVIFFHGSLHHIEELEEVLDLCALCLRGGSPGLLYVDEYVGPSRNEWRSWHVAYANGLFGRVPEEHRRLPEVTPPIVWEDPTEMIRSSEIVPLIEGHLEVVSYRPYFGNVLFPLVAAIKGSSLDSPEVLEVLREGVTLENFLAEHRLIDTMYAVTVARPKDGDN